MYEGNDVGFEDGGDNGNLILAGVVAAGTAVVAGVSYLAFHLGKGAGRRESAKHQWRALGTEQKRAEYYGDDYEAFSKLFKDLVTNKPVNSDRNGKVKS
jgi:hypothetical protein